MILSTSVGATDPRAYMALIAGTGLTPETHRHSVARAGTRYDHQWPRLKIWRHTMLGHPTLRGVTPRVLIKAQPRQPGRGVPESAYEPEYQHFPLQHTERRGGLGHRQL